MDALMTTLPKDWEIKTFRDISTINQGLQIPISQRLKAPTEHAKFYITIQALNNRKEFEYIKTYNESVVCHKDDILMTRTGNTGMVITNIEGVFHNNFFKINFDRTLINKDFLVYFLSLEQTQRTILKKAGTSTIPDLNHNDFYSLTIPLPPLNEQNAIANILSGLDRYLCALDSLIFKKEGVKKALSFELLSQRKRLKGFNQAWQRVRLGDILSYEQPTKYLVATTQYLQKGFTPILTAGKTFILGYTNDKHGIYTNIPVIIFDDFTTDSKMVNFPFKVKSSAIKILSLRDNNQADLKYIYEKLTLLKHQVTDHKRYWIDEFSNFEIPLPPLNEQSAIANILSALDNEITSLKNKKRQFENIKKALNHDLMSAKIRVLEK
ncbi:hypothetical protein BTM401_05630 [Helicobacter pylori]